MWNHMIKCEDTLSEGAQYEQLWFIKLSSEILDDAFIGLTVARPDFMPTWPQLISIAQIQFIAQR